MHKTVPISVAVIVISLFLAFSVKTAAFLNMVITVAWAYITEYTMIHYLIQEYTNFWREDTFAYWERRALARIGNRQAARIQKRSESEVEKRRKHPGGGAGMNGEGMERIARLQSGRGRGKHDQEMEGFYSEIV